MWSTMRGRVGKAATERQTDRIRQTDIVNLALSFMQKAESVHNTQLDCNFIYLYVSFCV